MRKLTVLSHANLVLMTYSLMFMKTYVHAIFSSGATEESCVSLQPPDSSPQDPSTNPYPLTVHEGKSNTVVETYYWNQTLTVSIGTYPHKLRGILLQARSVGSSNAVGEFVNIGDGFQYLGCSGSPEGTITNTDDSLSYKLSFYWTSGGHLVGDIKFLVTVGNTRDEYWTFGSGVISVKDTTLPTIMIYCPADVVVTSLSGSNGNSVSWSSPQCMNSTGYPIDVTCNETNRQFATISPAKTVQCWCSSRYGLVATCDFQYTVQDITPPVISICPNETEGLFFYQPNDQSKANATWIEPHAFDNSGNDVIVSHTGGNNGDLFSLGTTTVSYMFTDSSGNSNQCIFNVTVLVITPPVISNCPNETEGLFFYLPNNQSKANATWIEPHAFDNSGNDVIVSHTGGNNGDLFSLGTTTVSYLFTDSSGNSNQCIFNVTVLDITPPVISNCPNETDDLFFYLPNNQSKANATWIEPHAFDNSGNDVIVSHTGGNNGDFFSLGTTTVSYLFTDSSGNSNQCIFNVTVLDNIPPDISGCEYNNTTIYKYLPTDESVINVTWAEPFATDNSAVDVNLNKIGETNGDLFILGTTSVEYIFSDTSGNSAQCKFDVTVLDITPPVVVDFQVQNGTKLDAYLPDDASEVVVSWSDPRVVDNSDGIVHTSLTGGRSGDLFPLGITTIRYLFTDTSGNSNQYIFYIDVKDITPPKTDCPHHNEVIRAYLPANESKASVSWIEPHATDNSGLEVEIVRSGGSNEGSFSAGVTNITYTFTDTSGNSDECTIGVLVLDVTPPTVHNCDHENDTLEVYLLTDENKVNVTWTELTATDNSGIPVVVTHTGGGSGDLFPLGRSSVRYTFTDASGNNQFCVFDVLVLDITPPVIMNCPNNSGGVEGSLPSSSSHVIVSWIDPIATDNSALDVNMTLRGGRNGGVFYAGKTELTYTFTDSSDNQNQCTFNVTVVDTTPPVVVYCPSDIRVPLPFNRSTVTATWKAPSVVDNSGDAVRLVQSGGNIGDLLPLGVTTVTYQFYDSSYNYNQCSFNVIVIDVTEPVIKNCPIVIFTSTCGERENVAWLEPTATDNSKRFVQFKASEKPGDAFTIGNHTVIYTFEDESGNTALCSFLVQVEKKTDCTHHASYVAFVAIGFYLLLFCLAIALLAFLLYRRKRNNANYTIFGQYRTLSEPQYPHSNIIELANLNTRRTALDVSGAYDGSVATGGIDPEYFNSGYVDLEKPEKLKKTLR